MHFVKIPWALSSVAVHLATVHQMDGMALPVCSARRVLQANSKHPSELQHARNAHNIPQRSGQLQKCCQNAGAMQATRDQTVAVAQLAHGALTKTRKATLLADCVRRQNMGHQRGFPRVLHVRKMQRHTPGPLSSPHALAVQDTRVKTVKPARHALPALSRHLMDPGLVKVANQAHMLRVQDRARA